MSSIRLEPLSRSKSARTLGPTLQVPGDKSISHRALVLGSLATGSTRISNLLQGHDVVSTQKCLQSLGVEMSLVQDTWTVKGRGRSGLQAPTGDLDCGNSGTTLRLLMGVLARQHFSSTLVGDPSLSRRPMKRIADPLRQMGAAISLTQNETAPVTLHATSLLNGINYSLPIASAQLKSALLLAGLAADGTTDLTGKLASRDHTERLLKYFGCQLSSDFEGSILTRLSIPGGQSLRGSELSVPGDISSAAFWLVLATLLPHCRIEIDSVLLNPTRTGLVEVLKKMGAPIKTEVTSWEPEPVGWIHASHSELKGIEITAEDIPSLIDELPLIAVLATFAHGTTLVRGAEELRVKETDRLAAIAQNLRAMGAQMELFADGFAIHGPQPLHGATLYSFGDHRIAMAFSIAAVNAQGPSQIIGSECVSISYPDFYETLNSAF